MNLQEALGHPLWVAHKIGDEYSMDGKGSWRIAYYPIFEDGKTQEQYSEPRVLVETPIENGIDFREVPLRYLTKKSPQFLEGLIGACTSGKTVHPSTT